MRAPHSTRVQFRRAQLQAKRNEEAAKRKERERLFAGIQSSEDGGKAGSGGGYGRRRGNNSEKLTQDELVVNASSDVTAALRRTHQLMQTELQRSQFAHETLRMFTSSYLSPHQLHDCDARLGRPTLP